MRDLVFQPAAAVFAEELASEEGYYVAQNLTRLGSNAVPALLAALQSTNPVVRRHAASVFDDPMGESPVMQNPRILDCLPVLFQDPEPEVRMSAAVAAGSSRNPKFEEPLINLLRDPDEGVRHAAVFAVNRNYYGKSRMYHNRGCLYYNAHKFTEALADFRKSCELGSDAQDYSYARIWLIRARAGEKEAATRELAAYLEHRKTGKPDDWPAKVGRFLAGQLTEPDFLEAAKNTNVRTDQEQHCEAYFYVGSKRLIEGDQAAAADYFKKSVVTEVKTFEEYESAAAELKFLPALPAK
jgi:tetratricopeptide (TPR) repeat protein